MQSSPPMQPSTCAFCIPWCCQQNMGKGLLTESEPELFDLTQNVCLFSHQQSSVPSSLSFSLFCYNDSTYQNYFYSLW